MEFEEQMESAWVLLHQSDSIITSLNTVWKNSLQIDEYCWRTSKNSFCSSHMRIQATEEEVAWWSWPRKTPKTILCLSTERKWKMTTISLETTTTIKKTMKITLSLRTRIKKMRITIIEMEMDRRTRKEWTKTIMKRTPITSRRSYPRTEDDLEGPIEGRCQEAERIRKRKNTRT